MFKRVSGSRLICPWGVGICSLVGLNLSIDGGVVACSGVLGLAYLEPYL